MHEERCAHVNECPTNVLANAQADLFEGGVRRVNAGPLGARSRYNVTQADGNL